VLFLVVALPDSAEEPDQVVVGIDTGGGLWVGTLTATGTPWPVQFALNQLCGGLLSLFGP
jgi:hypothetical protein